MSAADLVEIRGYRPDDRVACRRLWEDLTEWHRALYGSPGIGGNDPRLLFDEHLAAAGDENILLADMGGTVVGMTGLIVRGSEIELEPLVVSPDRRGQGIGTMLATAVIERARSMGARTVVVKPAARNMAAIGLFVSQGFDVLGQVELMLDLEPGERTWEQADLSGLSLRY